tara:strand:+ start:261 stop:1241 length:981 start_codon:yes stop_codon:yes gene_type:complete
MNLNKKPFFTICTEVNNREKTIERAMDSIALQDFTDYEYIIVDNCSEDQSHEVISSYLEKNKSLNIKTTYIKLEKKLQDIASWNKPLEFATGKYIVVCEGDDWFESSHLSIAHKVLTKNHEVGMYVSLRADLHNFQGDNLISEEFYGYLNSSDMLKKLISFDFAPPPSNVIFKRELNDFRFNYDSENYVYAGEISLYYELLIKNLDVYVNSNALTVNRGFSSYPKSFFHIKDFYFAFNKWLNKGYYKVNSNEIRAKLFKSSLKIFFPQLLKFTFEKKMINHLLSEAFNLGIAYSTIIFLSSLSAFITLYLKLFGKKILNFLFLKKA